jgi:tetratricopeptide (TPR) repeat protein
MASSYHQLGILAQHRGDYDEAARQYQHSLDINERHGNQARMATGYHQLGMLAQLRGDYDEAARQYQHSLDINERHGDQAGIAASYGQFGNLEHNRGGSAAVAIAWHVRALAIRLRLGVPQAANNLSSLGAYRRDLGAGAFASLLAEATDDAELVEVINSLLDQPDEG